MKWEVILSSKPWHGRYNAPHYDSVILSELNERVYFTGTCGVYLVASI